MFKITPIQDKTRQNEVCALCNTTMREGAFAYVMLDIETGSVMGMSQFEILGDEGRIYDVRSIPGLDDDEAMFILTRQTMNFIDMCGSHTCFADVNAADEKLLHAAGFRMKDDIWFADMNGMFDGKCDH